MALRFTGNTSAATNYIRVINPASKLSPQLPMSFGCFGRRQSDTADYEELMHTSDFSAQSWGIILSKYGANTPIVWFPATATSGNSLYTGQSVVEADGWVSIICTADASGTLTFYTNGVKTGTETGRAVGTSHDNDVMFGVPVSSGNAASAANDVEACEWFVHNRALSAVEVARIAVGYEPPAAGRLMYVSGEDASGNDADGNTVTVVGSPEVTPHPPQIKRKNRVNLLSQARSQNHLQLVEEQDKSTEVVWRPLPQWRKKHRLGGATVNDAGFFQTGTVPASITGFPTDENSHFSMGSWVKPNELETDRSQYYWGWGRYNADTYRMSQCYTLSGQLNFNVLTTAGANTSSNELLIPGQWNHCVSLRTYRTASSQRNFVNGVTSGNGYASSSNYVSPSFSTAGRLTVGNIARQTQTNYGFNGVIGPCTAWFGANPTDEEIVEMSQGRDPRTVQPSYLALNIIAVGDILYDTVNGIVLPPQGAARVTVDAPPVDMVGSF